MPTRETSDSHRVSFRSVPVAFRRICYYSYYSYYSYYMNKITLKVSRIGNSRGVRIPAETIKRLDIGDSVIMEERSDAILLRPVRNAPIKLSWAETAVEIAKSAEDWTDWDTLTDRLSDIPWSEQVLPRVAEPESTYKVRSAKKGIRRRGAT